MPRTKKEKEREKAIKKFNPPKPKKSKKEKKEKTAREGKEPKPKKGKKKSKKSKKEKKGKAESNGQLTGNERKVLDTLKEGRELNRKQMSKKTEIKKGWSRMLGAATKGEPAASSLEGRGFITSKMYEGSRVIHYTITNEGKKALEAE